MAKVARNSHKGGSKPGERRGGRQKGTPNKTTADVKAAIALLAQENIGKVQGWLDLIAADDPEKALRLFLDLLEFNTPKQARTVLAGDPENPLNLLEQGVATVTFPAFTTRPTR